jgi:anti-sigma factor RsiW
VLSAYLDGGLPGDALKNVAEHLVNCPDCNSVYERMKADRNLLLEYLPDVIPPAHVKQQLFRRINAAPQIPQRTGILAWTGIGRIFSFEYRAWIFACVSVFLLTAVLSIFQFQRLTEDARILAEIDRSKAEWVARDFSVNPFNIDIQGAPLQAPAENPFKFYLDER